MYYYNVELIKGEKIMARRNKNTNQKQFTVITEPKRTVNESKPETGYKIAYIKNGGVVSSYDSIDKDAMETKVLEIMEKNDFKKIIVLNKKTKERKVYLSE